MTKPANTTDTGGDQLRAFVERIMRMREEAKAINDDIREIYAEAKGNGFDKTVLGKVVLYVEKRSKDASAVQESDALFELYLEAFDGRSSHAHARAREIIEEFPSADPTHVAADPAATVAENVRVAADHIPDAGKMVGAGQSTGNVDGSAGRSHSSRLLSTESPASVPVDTKPEPGSEGLGLPDREATVHSPAPVHHPQPVDLAGLPEASASGSNSHLQDDLGDQAGDAAAGLSNTRDMRRDSLKPVGLSIGAADIPHEGQVH